MSINELEKFLLEKEQVIKTFPFGEETMVFKVKNKIFALLTLKEEYIHISLKCQPQEALIYRELYSCVSAGYHLNKKHWNTVIIDGSMRKEILLEMIDDSYSLVVKKLSLKNQKELKAL